MKNRQRSLAKVVIVVIMGLVMATALSSLGLAQEAKVRKDAAKMMSDAWKMFDDGQRTVIKGLEMNNLIAAKLGVEELMKPGNKTMGTGRDTIFEGAKLFAQGEKIVMTTNDAKVFKEGVDMLKNGMKIAMDGKGMMEKGIAMNNQVAESKGAVDKFADGNKIMKDGMGTMAEGIKLYMQGEALYLGNK